MAKEAKAEAVGSVKRYFEENFAEPVGDLAAGLLVDFFVQEVGPVIYNRAIGDAQARLTMRVADLHGELFAEEFQYWPKVEAKRKKKR
ncbi:MAG: DUF2164 domain-containing protein [Acidobacteriota bacterium]